MGQACPQFAQSKKRIGFHMTATTKRTLTRIMAAGAIVAASAVSHTALAQSVNLNNTVAFANQDSNSGTVFVNQYGALVMRGNRWQATQEYYDVTPNTVLEFLFRPRKNGEIHGIGLENDNAVSSQRIFKLAGSQNWGIRGEYTYDRTDGKNQKFTIPIGQYYTGTNLRVVFVSDNDVNNPQNVSVFKNVKLYESTPPPTTGCITPMQQQLLDAHNNARSTGRQCGNTYMPAAPALTWNCKLGQAAANHSQDMATNDFFSHTGSDGLSPFDRMSNLGYNYRTAGENIFAGGATVSSGVNAWLQSPGHCTNIMGQGFTEMGGAMKQNSSSTYNYYWTVNFGAPQ